MLILLRAKTESGEEDGETLTQTEVFFSDGIEEQQKQVADQLRYPKQNRG